MALDILSNKGVPLERQVFDWRDIVRAPISKLDDDAFTRVRIILMNGIEMESIRFSHSFARMNEQMRLPLARVRRVDAHQQALVNWLLPADQSNLETTIGYEQVAIEVTAAVAQQEPDPYLAQIFRFGMLEDFDHLYRYSALMDRLEGRDANNITQCYTDIRPGRPTMFHHRAPEDDLRTPYDATKAAPITKLNCLTILSAEQQTHNFYANVGPSYADPLARQLYAEILSVEEQHVTQYESIIDPRETWMEKWLLHEANEVYNYWSCREAETNTRLRQIWDRFLDYELGQLHFVMDLFRKVDKRDPMSLLPKEMPDALPFASQRKFVRDVLSREADLRARGPQMIPASQEAADSPSAKYRAQLNSKGSPSEIVAQGYHWVPGTELMEQPGAMTSPAH